MNEIKTMWLETFEPVLKKAWSEGSDQRVDIDKSKIKFKDFCHICAHIIVDNDLNGQTVFQGASRIFEALAQINVCEDFGCARMMQSVSHYAEGLKLEFFNYSDSSGKHKITAWEFIEQSYLGQIDPYHMKTNIVGARNTYESPIYASKKAVGD